MPQTSLLSFFTPPAKLTVDSNAFDGSLERTPPTPPQRDELPLDEGNSKSSKILEALLLSNSTNSSPCVVLPHMPNAAIVKIQSSHLPKLKNITSTLLPVRYSDKFFNECIQDQTVTEISRVALYDSKPVGWIRCRLELVPSVTGGNEIYIQVLGVLAPYRNNGLASALLNEVLSCRTLLEHKVKAIYAHVWEANSDAIEWYERRGFKRIMLLQQYYRRLKPAGAWIVRKDIVIEPIVSST